jgi:choline dehydrogenase-like flavoprotein
MYCVIGSGPASISATMALVKRGHRVTILDAGRRLEPARQAVLERLAGQKPDGWSAADLDRLRGDDQSTRHGAIHSKLTYGSEYPYEDIAEPLMADRDHSPFHYSMARGGLSNVWGASILPAHPRDMDAWPICAQDLAEHYRAVLDFMPSTGVRDELEDLLPVSVPEERPLAQSRQITQFLEDLRKRRPGLRKAGIHFGRSRVAVKAEGCVYCGLCLYGCPYSLIYSSAQTLERLVADGLVDYRPGVVVERLEPAATGVVVHTRDAAGAAKLEARRVFVGAGVLPSAWLALHSLDIFDEPVTMLDSQYFIFPFFRFFRTPGVDREPLHSLVQAFLEIEDPRVSRHLVHVEVFSHSDFLRRALMATPLRFALWNRWMQAQMFDRLLVLQCFLHSDDSSRLTLRLHRDANGRPKLEVKGLVERGAYWSSLKAGLKLAANGLKLGGLPVVPAMQFAEPGRSYHSGGAFPMRRSPGRLETDVLGQLPGLPRVHFIDASIFPSIPATTITLTVMANAHRIAAESMKDEG